MFRLISLEMLHSFQNTKEPGRACQQYCIMVKLFFQIQSLVVYEKSQNLRKIEYSEGNYNYCLLISFPLCKYIEQKIMRYSEFFNMSYLSHRVNILPIYSLINAVQLERCMYRQKQDSFYGKEKRFFFFPSLGLNFFFVQ